MQFLKSEVLRRSPSIRGFVIDELMRAQLGETPQYSVLGTQYSVLGTQYLSTSVLSSQFSVLGISTF